MQDTNANKDCPTRKATNALSLLSAFAQCQEKHPSLLVCNGGIVNDVSRTAVAARGLSDLVSLGDSVLIDCGDKTGRGEIIRVNEDHVLIKPYDETVIPSLCASVFPNGPLFVAPDETWRGRVVNALGEAIDDKGPIISG